MNLELNNYRGQDFGQATISSLDVAEMVGRRHDNVMRDLSRLQDEISLLNFEEREYIIAGTYEQRGKEYKQFFLTKKGCELYGTRMTGIEGTAFAIKYIERFNEMEQELQPKLPTSYKDALLALVAQVEKTEELEKTIAIQAPKAEYTDNILLAKGTMAVTQISKDYGMSGIKFNRLLNELGVQHRVNRQWVVYAKYEKEGYVKSKTGDFGGYARANTHWTQKGRMFLYELLKKNGILPIKVEK